MRRFRNFALFWIIILVAYFAGMGWVLDRTKTSTLDALPVFLLITAILIVASGWHAVAIAVMSLNGLFEKTPKRGPWSN